MKRGLSLSTADLVQYSLHFKSSDIPGQEYSPTVSMPELRQWALAGRGLLPYGLDSDILPVLPLLWFCLSLPRSRFDFLDSDPAVLAAAQQLDHAHQLLVIPLGIALPQWIVDFKGPVVSFVADDRLGEVSLTAKRASGCTRVLPMSQATGESGIRDLWEWIGTGFGLSGHDVSKAILGRARQIGSDKIGAWWMYRSFAGNDSSSDFDTLCNQKGPLQFGLEMLAQADAYKDLIDSGSSSSPGLDELREAVRRSWHTFTCPVSVAAPGLSAQYLSDLGTAGSESIRFPTIDQISDSRTSRSPEFPHTVLSNSPGHCTQRSRSHV